jgi:hypothetical protein
MAPEPKNSDYVSFANRLIQNVIARHSLQIIEHSKSSMGEWYVRYENKEFLLDVWQDRSGYLGIELGSKIRRRPRAHMRGPWSMSHLRGYLDKGNDYYIFGSPEEEASWLDKNDNKLFNSSFLNSDELSKWAVKASRRQFGQDPKR